MALLHVSYPPAQTCGNEDILYKFFFKYFLDTEIWTPLQIPIWGPPWLPPVTLLFATTWMDLEGITQKEIILSEKGKYHIILLICLTKVQNK